MVASITAASRAPASSSVITTGSGARGGWPAGGRLSVFEYGQVAAAQVVYFVTCMSGSASQAAQAGLDSTSPGRRAISRRREMKKSGASCCRVLSNAGQALRTARQNSLGERDVRRVPGSAAPAPPALRIARNNSWVRCRISVAWGWVSSATRRLVSPQAMVAWTTALM